MKKRMVLLLLVLSLYLCPFTSPALAVSTAEPRTVAPVGVAEINLQAVLGDDASEVIDAWMLNAEVCVLLRSLPEQAAENYELIVLNMRDLSILSKTPVPYAASLAGGSRRHGAFYGQGRNDGAFYLLFEPEGMDLAGHEYHYLTDPEVSYIKATVAADGTVDFSLASSRLTIMPSGKTAVREGYYGSLYAVDMATGEDELLIQGTAAPYATVSYAAYLKYVPFWDDYGFYREDEYGNPLPFTFPLDKDSFYGLSPRFYHGFSVVKPLDEHRFVYVGYGWEWDTGFGVYDLQTRTDHRITGSGSFCGIRGNALYGTALIADANTYESSPLPASVRQQLEDVTSFENDYADYDISPYGRLLALSSRVSWVSDVNTVTITDIRTGEILKTFDIDNSFSNCYTVYFYDDTRVMLLYQPGEPGSTSLYLFNAEPTSKEGS